MISWMDYDVKCEQYEDMRRAAAQHAIQREAESQQPRRVWWARWMRWMGRAMQQVGRSLKQMGAQVESRYS